MTRAFVVQLAVSDTTNPIQLAESIKLLLEESFDVIEVNPWDTPSSSPSSPPPTTFPAL